MVGATLRTLLTLQVVLLATLAQSQTIGVWRVLQHTDDAGMVQTTMQVYVYPERGSEAAPGVYCSPLVAEGYGLFFEGGFRLRQGRYSLTQNTLIEAETGIEVVSFTHPGLRLLLRSTAEEAQVKQIGRYQAVWKQRVWAFQDSEWSLESEDYDLETETEQGCQFQ